MICMMISPVLYYNNNLSDLKVAVTSVSSSNYCVCMLLSLVHTCICEIMPTSAFLVQHSRKIMHWLQWQLKIRLIIDRTCPLKSSLTRGCNIECVIIDELTRMLHCQPQVLSLTTLSNHKCLWKKKRNHRLASTQGAFTDDLGESQMSTEEEKKS